MKSRLHYFLLIAATAAAVHGQNLQAVLSRMDVAGNQFKAMTSHMDRITHVDVINDDTPESGTIRITRSKAKEIRVSLDFSKPEPKQVAISERKVEIYYPKANRVEEYDLGKYKSLVDQFVLLGFGTTGKDLQKAYNLKFVKDETVAEQKCSRIELDPKDSKVKKQYSKFELCIADPGGYPVLQKLIEPSGNYTSITYSDIKLNPDLRPEAMNLNLPAGVKREYPQK
jgi:outer membrane lipoprotein-sorting protein